MNARYRLNLSWFAVLVAAQTLVMSTFLVAAPVAAAGSIICSSESGFVLNRIASVTSAAQKNADFDNRIGHSFSAIQEYDSGYAAFVLANQAGINSGYAAKELVLANSFAMYESDSGYAAFVLAKQARLDSGYAAKELVLAKQAALVSTTVLESYRSSFSPDAGFMTLYNPLAGQAGVFCYVPLSR